MLQPNYHTCQPFPESARLEPPVECHDGDLGHFASDPTVESCTKQTPEELVSWDDGHGGSRQIPRATGSYTGAFPPDYVEEGRGPMCIHPFGEVGGNGTPGSGDFERRSGGLGGEGSAGTFGDAGCAVAATHPDGAGAMGLLVLVGAALALGRRRRPAR
jgi:MYXO-CTERM domain-containing protein